MKDTFRVGVTRDFLRPDGTMDVEGFALNRLDDKADSIAWTLLDDNTRELGPGLVRDFDALLVLSPQVTAETLRAERLKIVARFGVGYDNVDVDACTASGVLLTITPDGVRRPVAMMALTFLLSLTHRLLQKDRLTRTGRWSEKLNYMGQGLTGRTLGIIGLGNIGREILRLARPFDMQFLAHDPHVDPGEAAKLGADLVADLDALLERSDYVIVCCSLLPETHHLLDAKRLSRLKPSAYLINVARGAIVDQAALTAILREGRIAGAGLDVFEQEPIDPDDPLLKLENVIVAPHALAWTDETALGIGRDACQSIIDVAEGRVPRNVVNRGVLTQPQLRARITDRVNDE